MQRRTQKFLRDNDQKRNHKHEQTTGHARYRQKNGPSGTLADITITARVCGWPEADTKGPLIFVSSVWFFARGFIQIVGLARVLVRLYVSERDRSPGVGRSIGPHGPPGPRRSQRTTVRSCRRVFAYVRPLSRAALSQSRSISSTSTENSPRPSLRRRSRTDW